MPYFLVIGFALLGGLCHFFAEEPRHYNAAAFYYTVSLLLILVGDRFRSKWK